MTIHTTQKTISDVGKVFIIRHVLTPYLQYYIYKTYIYGTKRLALIIKKKLAMRQRTIFTLVNFVTPTNLNEFLEIKQRVAVHFKQLNFTMAMSFN